MSSDGKKPNKGVRFWCPAVTNSPDPRYKYATEPYPKDKSVSFTPGEYRNQALRIHIRGEAFFERGDVVLRLAGRAVDEAQGKGHLRFRPQDVVDQGLATVEQMAELGFRGLVPKAGAPAVEAKVEEPPAPVQEPAPARVPTAPELVAVKEEEVLPDFETMPIGELREWADKHDIFIDGRWGKETAISKLTDALKERGGK